MWSFWVPLNRDGYTEVSSRIDSKRRFLVTTFIGEIFPGITSIADPFKGILLDAYGVFWGGNDWGVLPGAEKIMEKLVSSGKIIGILSNSTQLATKEVNKLHLHGLI